MNLVSVTLKQFESHQIDRIDADDRRALARTGVGRLARFVRTDAPTYTTIRYRPVPTERNSGCELLKRPLAEVGL